MKVVLQRVSKAELSIEKKLYSKVGLGFLVLLGVGKEDTDEDIDWLVSKILSLRIFPDENGKMNRSVMDVNGELLIVSQFTLYASVKKGTRPSFSLAGHPDVALKLYQDFVDKVKTGYGEQFVQTGVFGADMTINLVNEGPVTITIDSKNRE